MLLVVVAVLLALACARKGLPPGGPRDETPPFVIATSPDSGMVAVPLEAPLEIEFSESMNKASVIDWVLLSPPRDFGKRSWDGARFRLSGGDDFQPHTTYTIIVGTGCSDYRERNQMESPYTFVFSTGDSIDQARIEGRLLARGQTAHGTMVWAFDLERAAGRPDTVLPDYIAQAGGDSTYAFLGLREGRRYVVAAHYDANRDREFDAHTEFLAFYPDTLRPAGDQLVMRGIDIDFRDPKAPGTVAGVVIDSTRATIEIAHDAAAPSDTPAAALADTAVAPADDDRRFQPRRSQYAVTRPPARKRSKSAH
jgi:hypothetical protein